MGGVPFQAGLMALGMLSLEGPGLLVSVKNVADAFVLTVTEAGAAAGTGEEQTLSLVVTDVCCVRLCA